MEFLTSANVCGGSGSAAISGSEPLMIAIDTSITMKIDLIQQKIKC